MTTVILASTGGVHNPFTVILLAYVALSASVLGSLWTWGVTVLAIIAFRLLFFTGLPDHTHHQLDLSSAFSEHLRGMWIAFSLAALLIAYFGSRVAETLRERERELRTLEFIRLRQEQLAALTTLAAGAAHELATPLGTIAIASGELERLMKQADPHSEYTSDVSVICQEVRRCKEILERMAGRAPGTWDEIVEEVRVGDLLDRIASHLGSKYPVHFVRDASCDQAVLKVGIASVAQAVEILVKNGVEASPVGEKVQIVAQKIGSDFTLSICDSGHGIPEELRSRVGEPFFTTKEAGKGLGLGVFLTRLVADRFGGQLTIGSNNRAQGWRGTAAVLSFPMSE